MTAYNAWCPRCGRTEPMTAAVGEVDVTEAGYWPVCCARFMVGCAAALVTVGTADRWEPASAGCAALAG